MRVRTSVFFLENREINSAENEKERYALFDAHKYGKRGIFSKNTDDWYTVMMEKKNNILVEYIPTLLLPES